MELINFKTNTNSGVESQSFDLNLDKLDNYFIDYHDQLISNIDFNQTVFNRPPITVDQAQYFTEKDGKIFTRL